jgi:hypothetical protein
MTAVTLIIAGFIVAGNGRSEVTFRATNLTPQDCQQSLQHLPQAIRESWGGKITITRKECR